jgi:hypothetical protein
MSGIAPITSKIVKKVIPKTTVGKVAAAAAAAVGINTVRNNSKPTDKKTTGTQPSDQIKSAEGGITVGQTGDGLTLSGLPKGFQISSGGAAQYEKGAGAATLANLDPAERAALLANMGRIPGLYSSGMAPSTDFINKMLKGGSVVPRLADLQALDKIASIADWSADTISNTVIKFANNPSLSQQFFGQVTAKPKAVSSPAALEAELNNKFLDIFEIKADPAAAKAYAKEINALENKGSVSSQQKEDILLKYIQKKATDQFNVGQTGMVPGVADKGALGRRVRSLRTAYNDNGIPIDEKQIYNKAVQSLRSEEAYQNEIDSVTMQASVVMPAFKDFFAQGKTARQVLSPWINTRAQVLGISADQIKISDMYDIGSGPAPVSIQDYKKQLYKSPEFKKTDAYKERSLGDMQTLLKAFNIG